MAVDKNYPPITPQNYRVTLPAEEDFEFVSAHTIFPYEKRGAIDRTANEFTQIVYLS